MQRLLVQNGLMYEALVRYLLLKMARMGVSVGVRGPVSIHPAFSIEPVNIESLQITKSVNSITTDKKSSDTMGTKHRVDFAVYTTFAVLIVSWAEKTGLL